MSDRHFAHWPAHCSRHLDLPETNLFVNAEISALRYPNKPYLIFYDSQLSFRRFRDEATAIGGYLEKAAGVKKGDRVLLFMQNSPQFALGYYGILRANAVVVPVNPMNLTDELRHYAQDSGATVAIVAQELYPRIAPLLREGKIKHVVVACYSDYLETPTDLAIPDFIAAPRQNISDKGAVTWADALAAQLEPGPLATGPDDLCVIPYTSGTTGAPKGCMHTHRSAMHTLVSGGRWYAVQPETVLMAVAPWFHVTGMQTAMNGPLFTSNTVVLLPRWDRETAAACVHRYGVGSWTAIPTMIIDFLANPNLDRYDLSSLRRLTGGGAAMPAAIGKRMEEMGVPYLEGYGLSETIAATHMNPEHRAKKQCLGIPSFDTDARVIDPETLRELGPGEVGEIVIHGPQLFQGYWKNPEATKAAFIEIDGKRFLRTGDLGRTDEDGYFFLVDRLKRMINASGYKVWPAEVESLMYQHPAIQEACVIASGDARRGETVKAIVVLKPGFRDRVQAQDIIDWSREHMAAYKVPRLVEFTDTLPKSAAGKILWRELQERERSKAVPA